MTSSSSPIQFIPLNCPNCGGLLNITEKQDRAFCNYCGNPFLVREALGAQAASSKKYMELADTAMASENWVEAYSYYIKALELDPENSMAWFGKAKASIRSGTLQNPRFKEANEYYEKSILYASPSEKQRLIELEQEDAVFVFTVYTNTSWHNYDYTFKLFYSKMMTEGSVSWYNDNINQIAEVLNKFIHESQPLLDYFDSILTRTNDYSKMSTLFPTMITLCQILQRGLPKAYRGWYSHGFGDYKCEAIAWLEKKKYFEDSLVERINRYTKLKQVYS